MPYICKLPTTDTSVCLHGSLANGRGGEEEKKGKTAVRRGGEGVGVVW